MIPAITVILTFIMFAAMDNLSAQDEYLRLKYPQGGEKILSGENITIKWESNTDASFFLIELWDANNKLFRDSRAIVRNTGGNNHSVTIFVPPHILGSRFRIRIAAVGKRMVYDMSRAYFSIIPRQQFYPKSVFEKNNISANTKISPNPNGGKFSICSNKIINEMFIYDINGKIIRHTTFMKSERNISIEIIDHVPGTCFLMIFFEDGSIENRMVSLIN